MKKIVFTVLLVLLLTACAPSAPLASEAPAGNAALLVTNGGTQQSFTLTALQALPLTEASFKGVAYKGVKVSDLLTAAGVKLDGFKAIKGIASDGYTVNYDPAQLLADNVIMAYALADGNPLTSDDGNFRLVLPDAEGKLNLRMLVELQIVP